MPDIRLSSLAQGKGRKFQAGRPLTAVTFVAVISAVVLQVAFVGQRDAGPRAPAAELGLGVAHRGG